MINDEMLIIEALKGHVRVNVDTKTVEVFDEFGTKMVLRDLDQATFDAFKDKFQNF